MIADLQPYDEYRVDGPIWCKRIPSHWNSVRNGRLFRERNQTGYAELPVLEVSLHTGVRVRDMDGGSRKQVMSDFSKYKRACQGDVAYNMMRMWQGAIGVVPTDGLVSPAYVVSRPFPDVIPSYYCSLFRTADYKHQIDAFSRGIVKDRNRLYWDAFKQMPSLLPPPDEQALIVRFLDWASVRLGKAIAAKRKVIGLLEEQKQAIIHRAVTRGLDDTVPLKPSGLDWLGDVPKHWEILSLRRCLSVRSGESLPIEALKLSQEPSHSIPVIGGNGCMGFAKRSNVSGEALVIGRVGALCGNVHLVDGVNWVTDNALLVTRHVGYDANYLSHLLRAMRLNQYSEANAQPLVTGGTIKSLKAPRPALETQRRIASSIAPLVHPYTNAVALTQSEAILLREYQTRLISDVVTGKLDVREFARSLPDDVSEEAAELAAAESADEDFATDDELIEESV